MTTMTTDRRRRRPIAIAVLTLCGLGVMIPLAWAGWTIAETRGVTRLGQQGVVLQQSDNDCGLAAMEMAGRALGDTTWTAAALAREIPLSRQGVSMLALRDFAQRHGVEAAGWNLRPRDLPGVQCPAIAFIDGHHYVFVERVTSEAVVLEDPALGRVQMPLATFAHRWTGDILLFGRCAGGVR
jgi:ABC-type bacteriocin/lantibiotic exporter with double-glycine peptidase domain